MANYQQKLQQLDGRQQELVRDNYELKDLCLYLDEERNCLDLSCPHCGEKILSRPNSVVPPDQDEEQEKLARKLNSSKNLSSPNISETSSSSSGVLSMSSQDSSAQNPEESAEISAIYKTAIEDEDTNETQKAIIQEMCNVVWKVLETKKQPS